MKTSCKAVLSAASLLTLVAPAQANEEMDPIIPTGYLNAFPTIVQTGTHPTLDWEIQYPEMAEDIITIEPGGTIIPKVDLCLDVRVLGASYQIGTKGGQPVWGYAQAEVKTSSNSGWSQFFYNTQDNVNPTYTYYSETVKKGTKIEFRARSYTGSYWKDYRSTESPSANVVAVVNGDTPPTSVPAFSQGNIESFLKPYMDAGGKIKIGPKDVIYLIELGQTNTSYSGFDIQDLVLLVSYDYCKNNNGHGNNADGVDVSNPGQGGGGPNGEEDESGVVDDEIGAYDRNAKPKKRR